MRTDDDLEMREHALDVDQRAEKKQNGGNPCERFVAHFILPY